MNTMNPIMHNNQDHHNFSCFNLNKINKLLVNRDDFNENKDIHTDNKERAKVTSRE